MVMQLVCFTISACSARSIRRTKNNIRAIPTNQIRKATSAFEINMGKALFLARRFDLPNGFAASIR